MYKENVLYTNYKDNCIFILQIILTVELEKNTQAKKLTYLGAKYLYTIYNYSSIYINSFKK